MGRLAGEVAIITGAGSGIGLALVQRFVAEGANVVACVQSAPADGLFPKGVAWVAGDVADPDTHYAALACAQHNFGKLDCFISNAGVWDFYKKLDRIAVEDLPAAFETMMRINVLALLLGARIMHDALVETKGSIIATTSNAAFMAGGGGALYTASKFALRGAVMQLASEYAPHVRVNSVAPGATATPLGGMNELVQAERSMNSDAARIAAMGEHIPMGRVSDPAEHAGLYVTLAAREDTSYVTGATFLSDGGLTISI